MLRENIKNVHSNSIKDDKEKEKEVVLTVTKKRISASMMKLHCKEFVRNKSTISFFKLATRAGTMC